MDADLYDEFASLPTLHIHEASLSLSLTLGLHSLAG